MAGKHHGFGSRQATDALDGLFSLTPLVCLLFSTKKTPRFFCVAEVPSLGHARALARRFMEKTHE
jgi:hypothetical protein